MEKLTLNQMIAAGRYDEINGNGHITEKNFLACPERFTTFNTRVYHFNKVMTTEELVVEMSKDGYEPAFIENLLAYGAENPAEQLVHRIVAPGSHLLQPDHPGLKYSPIIDSYKGVRYLSLCWLHYGWRKDDRFLAVRKDVA